tara:strand:- start:516 stop:1373 length:858 start_codon:yes stop_codon:yes gene_type:complete
MKKKLLKISLIGKTNAGKSTLINNFVGETISITNKKINTTEDLIEGVINIENTQLIFYDTPGFNLIKDTNKKNYKLKKNLWEGINNSDLILYIIDSTKFKFEETLIYCKKLSELNKDIIIIFNKNDLIDKKKILPNIQIIDKEFKITSFFSISAKYKLGIDYLKKYLLKKSYQSEWFYKNDAVTNKDDLFITNECTRNSILTVLHKEIPYNIKINNKEFKKLKNGDLKIKQEIQINNSRYKKIILGKKGSKIKEIRVRSQSHMSKILKNKVHLYINVIVSNAKKI